VCYNMLCETGSGRVGVLFVAGPSAARVQGSVTGEGICVRAAGASSRTCVITCYVMCAGKGPGTHGCELIANHVFAAHHVLHCRLAIVLQHALA
jgi:hypothetical protein